MTHGRNRFVRTCWRVFLFTIPLACAVLVALVAAEIILSSQSRQIQLSDHMDPGMSIYDPDLGWRLAPLWSGKHENVDFSTEYRVNSLGFRDDSPNPLDEAGQCTVVLGDSFVFGFGVAEQDTFIYRLNKEWGGTFVNCGVPGYSTDQQMLVFERVVSPWRPARVLLVVYLGNDLLDNPRPFPLQVELGKPFYSVHDGVLTLHNSPVPKLTKPPGDTQAAMRAAVLGQDNTEAPRSGLLANSVLFSALRERLFPERRADVSFSIRLADELELFMALVNRLRTDCQNVNAPLILAILPGRSLVEEPGSLSGEFQEYFRASIVDWAANQDLPVIDLAEDLRREYRARPAKWYFPHDGHLTVEGHEQVAKLLARALQDLHAK